MEIVTTACLLCLMVYGIALLVRAVIREEEKRHLESEIAWCNEANRYA